MTSHRVDRVADQVRAELAELLQREVKDPRVRLASVARVELSADLSHARVFLSILGAEEQRQECLQALQHGAGFLRRRLGERMRLRTVPHLHLELDRGAEAGQRISDLLDELRREPS